MPELDRHPEHESHYDCEFCRDTGKLDGSEYYDCAHCSVAQERVKLEERMGNMKRSMATNDAWWSLVKSERKRVLAVQAADLALLKAKLMQAEKDAERYAYLRNTSDWSAGIIKAIAFGDPEKFDAAIDAAMSTPNKGESK